MFYSTFSKTVALVVGVIAMVFLISYFVLAWTEPGAAPPSGNVPAPINVGSTDQNKTGGLGVNFLTVGYNQTSGTVYLADGASEEGDIFRADQIYGLNDLRLGGDSDFTGEADSSSDLYINANGDVSIPNGDLTIGGGSGKLTVGTIDPVFEIDGEKYATYLADFAGGVRIETSGVIELEDEKYLIDFDNLEKGSNLWLFWQASNKNLKELSVLLTPSFEGKVWYEKEGNILTIYGEKIGEVSYRLSTPRIDYQNWGNLAEDQSLEGIDPSVY